MRDGSDRVGLPYNPHAYPTMDHEHAYPRRSRNCLGIGGGKRSPGWVAALPTCPPQRRFFFSAGNFLLGEFLNVYDVDGERSNLPIGGRGPRVPLQPTITFFGLGYMLVAYDSHDKHPCPLSTIFPHRKIKGYGEEPNDSLQSAKWYAVFDNQAACVSTEDYILYQLAHVSPYFNVEIFFPFFSFPMVFIFFLRSSQELEPSDFISSSSHITTPHPCYQNT